MSRIAFILIVLELMIPRGLRAQNHTDLNKIYVDESHCLTGPEIRDNRDNPISCCCRDALVDARYVRNTYGYSMETMDFKDRNLIGTMLTLERNANEMCKDKENVLEASTDWVYKVIEAENWKWNGPEVTRKYPSDAEIERIKPNAHNIRTVPFTVTVTYRDKNGRVVKTESYGAHDLVPARDKNP